jgi:hypothetical protein
MRVRGLDGTHDWVFGKGKQSYRNDLNALKEILETRLASWKNGCFFDMPEGVDWTNYFDYGTKRMLDIDILRVVNTTGGVIKVIRYTSTIDKERKISISLDIQTIYGMLNIGFTQDA